MRAFAEVESGGRSGFGASGQPVIAYEGHVFRRLTQHAYDQACPLLSYTYVMKAGPEWRQNNKDQSTAWKTLAAALALDPAAALSACSWGMFQVMGENHALCGYATVYAFVDAMKRGARGHLDAFVSFCKARPGMTAAMLGQDFAAMASIYNGSDYGDYDKKIERAFRKYAGS